MTDEGVLDFRFIIVLAGAGIIGSGVDRPVRCEELSCLCRIEKLLVGVIVALKAGDRSKVSEVLNCANIEIADLGVDDVGEVVHGGDCSRLADQLDQQGFLHNEGLHGDRTYILVAEVAADRVDLVICDIEDVAGLISALSMVNGVIQSCDVSAGCGVALKEGVIVLFEDHAAGNDHNVLLGLSLDVFKVLIHSPDVGVVDGVYLLLCRRKDLQSAALGVDVVVTACSDMSDKGTCLAGNVNLLVNNAAVAQVRNREVNDTPFLCTPLNIAGLQRDLFTVCAANHCACTDLDIVSNQCAGNNCAVSDTYVRHKDRVDDLSALAYCRAGKDNGILNSSVNACALCDVSAVDGSIGSDIGGKSNCITASSV